MKSFYFSYLSVLGISCITSLNRLLNFYLSHLVQACQEFENHRHQYRLRIHSFSSLDDHHVEILESRNWVSLSFNYLQFPDEPDPTLPI